ncbi:DUF3027 domain-containing protein [Arthrobacter woluwensis]|uniref:DUF3027 domain-containing protein n=1 Tax=Arthrobacter woluwensis TaxID=156980 RepID=A0A1H4T3Y4_9MICC|nr:DUF3027 domain-containing protein [Arthrobacter woluwensis]SEC51173.1 Protein of unknown function [Arthrobacter woluwensis]
MTAERQNTLRTPAPKPGVPQWKTGKPDAMLAAAVDQARRELETITPAGTIGEHLGAKREEDRVVTHLFASRLAGYVGWQWFAVLTRNSRSKVVTVSEIGLLPSEDSVLAPPWVPWSERVRPEDVAAMQAEEETAAGEAGGAEHSGTEDSGQGDDADQVAVAAADAVLDEGEAAASEGSVADAGEAAGDSDVEDAEEDAAE